MSLRSRPLEREVTLPDGRAVLVRIGVPADSYIARADLDTVAIEVLGDGEHLAAVNTVLDADQESEARGLLRDIVAGLEDGSLEPTAGALEPLADTLR
jgi:hypothetical protein